MFNADTTIADLQSANERLARFLISEEARLMSLEKYGRSAKGLAALIDAWCEEVEGPTRIDRAICANHGSGQRP